MAKKKLDKDMINDVSGGFITEMADGRFAVVDKDGVNIYRNNRLFVTADGARAAAKSSGESTTYLSAGQLDLLRSQNSKSSQSPQIDSLLDQMAAAFAAKANNLNKLT